DRDLAQLMGRQTGQPAIEGADRRPDSAGNNDIGVGHWGLLAGRRRGVTPMWEGPPNLKAAIGRSPDGEVDAAVVGAPVSGPTRSSSRRRPESTFQQLGSG